MVEMILKQGVDINGTNEKQEDALSWGIFNLKLFKNIFL